MAQTLNEYTGTWPLNEQQVCVAPDLETAARTLSTSKGSDPILLQNTKQGIQVELPPTQVTFHTTVFPATALTAGCAATPSSYTLPFGTKQVFTAVAAAGWRFDEWEIDGAAASTDEVAYLTIPESLTQVSIVAHFVPSP